VTDVLHEGLLKNQLGIELMKDGGFLGRSQKLGREKKPAKRKNHVKRTEKTNAAYI